MREGSVVDGLLSQVHANSGDFREDFHLWLQHNAHVFFEFERRSLVVAERRAHYSARTIAEVMRHDSAIGELVGDFKINGNFVPCMARLFSIRHPRYSALFEFRRPPVKAAA